MDNATFKGLISITPPLTSSERTFLHRYAQRRQVKRPHGEPGFYCSWVASSDGTALFWSGRERFYDAAAWLRVLIEHFLATGSTSGPKSLGRNHVLNGSVSAVARDGSEWTVDVVDNVVTASETSESSSVFRLEVIPRGVSPSLDREYDAAFDLDLNSLLKIPPGEFSVRRIVANHLGDVRDHGVEVAVEKNTILVTIELDPFLGDVDLAGAALKCAIRVAASIADELGWIVFDPLLLITARPGVRYRQRVMSRMQIVTDERFRAAG